MLLGGMLFCDLFCVLFLMTDDSIIYGACSHAPTVCNLLCDLIIIHVAAVPSNNV